MPDKVVKGQVWIDVRDRLEYGGDREILVERVEPNGYAYCWSTRGHRQVRILIERLRNSGQYRLKSGVEES